MFEAKCVLWHTLTHVHTLQDSQMHNSYNCVSTPILRCVQEGPVRRPGPAEPFAGSLSSEHVRAEASGWQTRAGQRLRRPATASLQYTPALARRVGLGFKMKLRREGFLCGQVSATGPPVSWTEPLTLSALLRLGFSGRMTVRSKRWSAALCPAACSPSRARMCCRACAASRCCRASGASSSNEPGIAGASMVFGQEARQAEGDDQAG
jgi:hypothetical protein